MSRLKIFKIKIGYSYEGYNGHDHRASTERSFEALNENIAHRKASREISNEGKHVIYTETIDNGK